MAENVLSYEDRVLDSMMDKAFEKAGVDDYSFSEELKRIYRGHIESYPGVRDFFNDLAYGGCLGRRNQRVLCETYRRPRSL